MAMKKLTRYASGLACVVLIQTPAFAEEHYPSTYGDCAVSEINGKLSIAGGATKDKGNKGAAFQSEGSVSFPINCQFGLQLDGALGKLDGKSTGGVAAHAFTRIPSSYLLGAYGSYSGVGSNDVWRLGAEAEYYIDKVTLSGLAGYENSDRTKGDVFAVLGVSYYATDNFKVSAGYSRFLDVSAAAFGAEYQIDNMPASLFVSGQVGNKDHRKVLAGVRYYFGGAQKSLIRRDREDDPLNFLNLLIRNIATPAAPVTTPPAADPPPMMESPPPS